MPPAQRCFRNYLVDQFFVLLRLASRSDLKSALHNRPVVSILTTCWKENNEQPTAVCYAQLPSGIARDDDVEIELI